MKFGMLHLFENPRGRTEQDMVEEQIELMAAAEGYGFDSCWPAEHHFSEYGFCASPALQLAAIARSTSTIRLCSGVVVLPFNNPLRVAEDYAMLDLLSNGRVELGLGRGYQPTEFAGFGVDQTKSTEIFNEGLEVIKQAWTQDKVNFKGKHYEVTDVEVRPKPLQKPHPPIWIAGLSDSTFERAGHMGYNLLCSPIFGGTLPEAKEKIVSYRNALKSEGIDPASREVGALIMVYVGETTEQARAEFAEPVIWYFRTFGKFVAPKLGQPAVEGYESYTSVRDMAASVEWDALLEHGAVICGDAEFVTERLREVRDVVGIDHLLCWTRLGGLATEKVLAHMERMRDTVMPALR